MNKMMTLLLGLTMSAGAMAQTTTATTTGSTTTPESGVTAAPVAANTSSATTTSGTIDKLKAMKLSARLETETFTDREGSERSINSIATNLYPMLTYTPVENSSFWIYPQVAVARNNSYESETHYSINDGYVALRFDQMKILKEAQQGIDFSASSRYYARVTPDSRADSEQYGELNLRFYGNKKFGNRFSVYAEPRFYFVNTDDHLRIEGTAAKNRRSTATYRHDIYLIPEYSIIKDRLAVYIQTLQSERTSRDSSAIDTYGEISTGPGVNYQVNDKFALGALFGTYLYKSHKVTHSNLKLTASATYQLNPNFRIYGEAIAPFYDADGNLRGRHVRNNFTVEVDLSIVAF
ncbi:MAG: hypothetical protein HQK50_01120 [Oligoflexia bacterium]|nr:hypothetical protein [Oligoflexia bacterium]